MSDDKCKRCGHEAARHRYRGADCSCRVRECDCEIFVAPDVEPMERIAVALESIARTLDAMRRDGR